MYLGKAGARTSENQIGVGGNRTISFIIPTWGFLPWCVSHITGFSKNGNVHIGNSKL